MLDTKSKETVAKNTQRRKDAAGLHKHLGKIFRHHNTVILFVNSQSGQIVDLNYAAETFYGYSRTEMTKLKLSDLSPLPLKEYELLRKKYIDQDKSSFVCPHKLASGAIHDVEIHSSKIDLYGEDLDFTIIHDITERITTEKKLQFRHDYESHISSISTFFIRPDHYEIDAAVNKALKTIGEFMRVDQSFILQFSDDLSTVHLTHTWSSQVFKQSRTLINTGSDKFAYATGRLFKGEIIVVNDIGDLPAEADSERGLMKHNRIKSFIIVPTILKGMVIGGIGFSTIQEKRVWSEDSIKLLRVIGEIITNALKRRQIEDALRESENKYRRFFEEDLTGDFIVSPSGELYFCNPAFAKIFGFKSVHDALNNNIDIISSPNCSIRDELKKLKKDINIEEVEYELQRIDGEPVYVIANLHGVYDEYGKLKEYKGYMFDITKHKKVEEQLRGAQKMEAIGRLAGGIAHDFNNILTVINGYTELLLNSKNLKINEQNKLKQIKRAGERAASLTGQLLAFSRKQIVKPKIINLNSVLTELENMLQRLIGENIRIYNILDDDVGSIKMDPTQLEQVILNLAINARDAMPLGGKLILRTEDIIFENDKRHQNVLIKSGSYIKLSVSDTGIGMKPEIQSHIFEPFFTTKEKGTGLGLATIYGIIKQGDGYITVDSFPEKGTTFEIFFPRQEMSIEKEEEIPRVEIKFTGSEKIMVIEDDELVRNLTVSFLENFGYKVTQASSSQIALQICVDKPNVFDLAIIDVVMPGISGKKLAERISESQKNIKVLFISGYTDEAIVQHGILDSSVHFLQKPFSAKTLAQKTRSILDDI